MRRLLVIEDGDEYSAFVHALLGEVAIAEVARTGADALAKAAAAEVFLFDLRFDRAEPGALLGEVDTVARELFGGDRTRALRHLQDQQGLYILRALRAAGHRQRAIFVHDFTPRRLGNLRGLYGDVAAVPGFDASAIARLLQGGA
jgi:hypothetical protein